EYYHESKKECIETLKKELETLKQEKEGVDGKLAGLLTASKDLDNLIESQRGNHRNWNNLKSHQLGPDFLMKKKACFNCVPIIILMTKAIGTVAALGT
nr:hypothetical protein [Tanacetum cinerariifolium]